MRTRPLALVLLVAFAGCAESITTPLSSTSETASAIGDGPRTLVVSGDWDSGPGSLRDALEEASADPQVVGIRIEPWVYSITPYSTLTFTGTQRLTIDGGQTMIYGHYVQDALFDLRVRNAITIHSIGVLHSPGVGIRVIVPEDATGTVRVTLNRSLLIGHRGHGLLVTDMADYLTDPNTTSALGSAASLRVEVTGSHFGQIGQGGWDYDGSPLAAIAGSDAIHVNEGGDGSAIVILRDLQLVQAGHDAVHVDERGNGNIDFTLESSTLFDNGWANPDQPGNGVRLVESGGGTLKSYVHNVGSVANAAQAFGFSESGAGNLTANFVLTTVSNHAADAIVLIEDAVGAGGGNLTLDLTDSEFESNGQDLQGRPTIGTASIIVQENLGGTLTSRVTGTVFRNSLYGGIIHREEAGGHLLATITASTFSQLATFGLRFDENGGGDLTAAINGGAVVYNGTVGITAEQAPNGLGTLTLTGVDLQSNGSGAQHVEVTSGQVTVVQTP